MIPRGAAILFGAWFGASCAAGRVASGGAVAMPVTAQPGDTAIADVSVVPMSRDGILAHHTVVIRGDRIVAVAPRAAVVVPAGVTVIDGAGKWLMPGLADMHVHAWHDDDLTMFVAAGVTTVRNMWGVPLHLAWRSQIARGERLGPTIVTAGGLIDGDPPDWPGSLVLSRPEDAEPLVAAQKAAGYDFLKPVEKLSREAFDALAAAGKRHGMVLAGHVTQAKGLEGVLAARQRSIEHLDGYLPALVPPGPALPGMDDIHAWVAAVVSRRDRARLPALIEQTLAAGTWNCPTLIANDRTPELYEVATVERRVQWLGLVPAAVRASWARDFAEAHGTAADAEGARKYNQENAWIIAALAHADAPILVGTDTGGPYVVAGESLHDEIELLVAAGVPRPRVLRAATADAWRYLGQPGEAGVVEPGARADLVLLASDPLAAPLPLVPDGVMLRGRWLPRADLEARLAEVARHAAPPDDYWAGAPPLAAGGTPARYDLAIGGTVAGQERLVVSGAGAKRTVAGQIADLGSRIDTSYTVGPDTATVATTYHTMIAELTGTVTAGSFVVSGHDLTGRPVALRAAMPAGAFVSAPGVGGALALVARLDGLKPGARRTLTALELAAYPAIAIVTARHDVERKPDRGGHRAFAVATTRSGATTTAELAVDAGGFVVTETLGPPAAASVTRRAP